MVKENIREFLFYNVNVVDRCFQQKGVQTSYLFARPMAIVFPESACEGFFVKKQPLYYIFTPSHLLIYIFTLSHLLIYIFTPSHLLIYIFTPSHLLIYIFTPSHLLI